MYAVENLDLAHQLGWPFQCSDKCTFRFCSFYVPTLCASFRRRRLRIWRWHSDRAESEKGDAADHADRDGGIAQAICAATCAICSGYVGCVKCSGLHLVCLDHLYGLKLRAKFESVQGACNPSATWQMPSAILWRISESSHRGWAASIDFHCIAAYH